VHDGRPYLAWLPQRQQPPWPAMVIVHGAGSRKENHGDFGRACAAAGWAALAYDQRGHGESGDEMSPQAVSDAASMARFLAERPEVDERAVCIRGSSMGGLVAIHAAAVSDAIAGVVAICPASEQHLLRGLRRDELEFDAGPRARADLEGWLGEHDVRDAVGHLGERALLLIHAEGDERIPAESSRELYERATTRAKKLIVLPGGHHRSAQHDAELQGVALRWLERNLGR
jgi:alpha-beta hydrolase superfamily lysophospholipase